MILIQNMFNSLQTDNLSINLPPPPLIKKKYFELEKNVYKVYVYALRWDGRGRIQ